MGLCSDFQYDLHLYPFNHHFICLQDIDNIFQFQAKKALGSSFPSERR